MNNNLILKKFSYDKNNNDAKLDYYFNNPYIKNKFKFVFKSKYFYKSSAESDYYFNNPYWKK